MNGDSTCIPPVAWAQRKDLVYLTIQMEDLTNKQLNCTDEKFSFKATGGQTKKDYAFDLEFYKKVIADSVREVQSGKQLVIVIKKTESGPFWPRIQKETKKLNWLKTDFDKWRDEDDSDVEESFKFENNDIESQMASLGNYEDGGDGGEEAPPADNEDSDDDALPDLE